MDVELDIKITSPLTPDDKDLLSGILVMTLAIANRELAAHGFLETFAREDGADLQPVAPARCGVVSKDGVAACVSDVGHRSRHRFRRLPVGTANEPTRGTDV